MSGHGVDRVDRGLGQARGGAKGNTKPPPQTAAKAGRSPLAHARLRGGAPRCTFKRVSAQVSFRVLDSISDAGSAPWDALLAPDATPFVRYHWLAALEESGCAGPRNGWTPQHLTLWRGARLIAAAPAYLKEDSDGDFARDWDFASAAQQARLRYFPKLALTVPFTPCTGSRLLVAPGEDRAALVRQLLQGAEALAREQRWGSLQVLFPNEAEAGELELAGWAVRVSSQFHWYNRGYQDLDDFLSRLNSKKRSMLRREMAQPAKDGLTIRTVREPALRAEPKRWAKTIHSLHAHTVDQLMWGRRWLNQGFYDRIFATMPDALEAVVAEKGGEVIAGAFNVASATRLYGRYWGSFEQHPFLHFNVCYYHSLSECIARGTRVFEGGAGGEHKLPRGFEPSITYAAHRCLDARLEASLRRHLAEETPARAASIARFREEAGVYKKVQEQT